MFNKIYILKKEETFSPRLLIMELKVKYLNYSILYLNHRI